MTDYHDEEVVTEGPRRAKRGSKQGRVDRTVSGEPLLTRSSTVVQAEIKGSPKIAEEAKRFEKILASRKANYEPTP